MPYSLNDLFDGGSGETIDNKRWPSMQRIEPDQPNIGSQMIRHHALSPLAPWRKRYSPPP
ncbi:MAG: hypothetical protein LZF60_70032 [Nitrospira sp.]|nr:MAG: hypothetical protein LZF60_70032 [Nitrospira sp.]